MTICTQAVGDLTIIVTIVYIGNNNFKIYLSKAPIGKWLEVSIDVFIGL